MGLGNVVGGCLLLGSAIPFTLIVIFPINKQLLDPLNKDSELAGPLLRRWGK